MTGKLCSNLLSRKLVRDVEFSGLCWRWWYLSLACNTQLSCPCLPSVSVLSPWSRTAGLGHHRFASHWRWSEPFPGASAALLGGARKLSAEQENCCHWHLWSRQNPAGAAVPVGTGRVRLHADTCYSRGASSACSLWLTSTHGSSETGFI